MPVRPARPRLLLAAGCAAALALLAWLVLARHGSPYGFDTGPHRWSVAHRPAAAATAARTVTHLGTGPYPYVAAALGGWLGSDRSAAGRRAAATAALAVAVLVAGQVVRTVLMWALHRARPPAADWATQVHGHAFPSGHTASAAIAAGLLAWGLLRWRPGPTGRVPAAVCGLVAFAVGCSRVYLGVHWPTDVLGGWLFAACWLAAALPPLASFASRAGSRTNKTDKGSRTGQTDTP